MFCPRCRDEFRPGFTRCESCGVDLVATLPPSGSPAGTRSAGRAGATFVPLAEYCGFQQLDDAREARDRLASRGLHSDILIRQLDDGSGEEEFWLRVERARLTEVVQLLGYDLADEAGGAGDRFRCEACGEMVAEDATQCPRCGARFEDDG